MKFKAFGVECEIKFLFVALIAFVSAVDTTLNILLTLIASLLHECGHLAAMMFMRNPPQKVVFELGGINIINQSKTCFSLNEEIIIALSGPFINLILIFLSCFVYTFLKNEKLLTFASVNIILMVFNLLPIKSLDGGRALFFLLAKNYDISFCKYIVNFFSIFFIIITFAWGIYVFAFTGYNFSIIIIAIFLLISLFNDKEC